MAFFGINGRHVPSIDNTEHLTSVLSDALTIAMYGGCGLFRNIESEEILMKYGHFAITHDFLFVFPIKIASCCHIRSQVNSHDTTFLNSIKTKSLIHPLCVTIETRHIALNVANILWLLFFSVAGVPFHRLTFEKPIFTPMQAKKMHYTI